MIFSAPKTFVKQIEQNMVLPNPKTVPNEISTPNFTKIKEKISEFSSFNTCSMQHQL